MILDVDALAAGLPGISPRFGAALAEAAVVCLESQSHASGVGMSVNGDFARELSLEWLPQSDPDQIRRSWADEQECTEYGACALAALLVVELTPWTVVERARKDGGGFDYWLGPQDKASPLFQGKGRLEVSGIAQGSASTIEGRVALKVRQTYKSVATRLPAIVVVIEFGTPFTRMVKA